MRFRVFSAPASGAAETTMESGTNNSNALTNGITEERAVAATVTPTRPPVISVGAPQPKATCEGVQGVSLSTWARTIASRKPEACFGSSKDRNMNRRAASMSSISAPASCERIRAPVYSANRPSSKLKVAMGASASDRPRFLRTAKRLSSACSSSWNFFGRRSTPLIDKAAAAASSNERDNHVVKFPGNLITPVPPQAVGPADQLANHDLSARGAARYPLVRPKIAKPLESPTP